MFNKLRNNMMMFNMITVALVIVIAFTVIFLITYANIERANERKMNSSGFMISSTQVSVIGGQGQIIAPPERLSADYSVSFTLYARGNSLEGVNSNLNFSESVYREALEKIEGKASGKISLEGKRWLFASSKMIIPINLYGRTIIDTSNDYDRIMFVDISDGVQTLRTLLITLILVGIVMLFTLFIFSYRFAARAVAPIEESYNRQKQFVEDASHELRTPIAIISTNIDAIETNNNETVESQAEWFGYIKEELKRTANLVDNLLYLAKADNITPEEGLPFDLSKICNTACATVDAALYDKGIEMNINIEDDVIVCADSEKILQVLYILLDNAGKYTPKNGQVDFSLSMEKENAVVHVGNTGEGISPEDLPKIFDRFYRPDSSRCNETGGAGLGLSIAKTILNRTDGDIRAESGNGYTKFIISLKSFQK